MIHKQVPGVAVFLVGDLQPMRMPYLLRLEGGVQILDADDSFGVLPLKARERKRKLRMQTATSGHPHIDLDPDNLVVTLYGPFFFKLIYLLLLI